MKLTKSVWLMCLCAGLSACGGGNGGDAGSSGSGNGGVSSPTPVVAATLQTQLDQLRTATGYPGLSAVVVADGKVDVATSGVRSLSGGAAVQAGDQFQMNSLTKAATAMLIARLVEQKKLRWDSSMAEVFPSWSATMDPALRSVTVEQLLRHRSGVKRDITPDEGEALLPLATGVSTADRATLGHYLLQQAPAYTPGTRMSYSNLGYMLAGLVAETVGGKPYAALMQQEVFGPLNISAAIADPQVDGANGVSGHSRRNGAWEPTVYDAEERLLDAVMEPARGLVISMPEYAKLLQEQLAGIQGKSTYLSAATYRLIHTPVDGYGLGWEEATDPVAGPVSHHSGGSRDFTSYAIIVPRKNRVMAIACNCSSGDSPEVLQQLLAFVKKQGINTP